MHDMGNMPEGGHNMHMMKMFFNTDFIGQYILFEGWQIESSSGMALLRFVPTRTNILFGIAQHTLDLFLPSSPLRFSLRRLSRSSRDMNTTSSPRSKLLKNRTNLCMFD